MNLQQLLTHLNVDLPENKSLRFGKKRKNKNRYYYFRDEYYIVKLTQDKWCIFEDCRKTRELLRLYSWCYHHTGYARTDVFINGKKKSKYFHQLFLEYDNTHVADHINRCKFDNRDDNLRIVTHRENDRNKTKQSNNTSGKPGVYKQNIKQKSGKIDKYWQALICDDNGNRISKSFPISKHGDTEAKRLAVQKRKELEILYGYSGD
jgi:hypothetical protein